MADYSAMMKGALLHANNRADCLPKKFPPSVFKTELKFAYIAGELSGMERMLQYIIDNKTTLTIEDLEAEIHQYLAKGLTELNSHFKTNDKYGLEVVLDRYGYYKKDN